MEAEPGAHDDMLLALAIAHYIRPQQRYTSAAPLWNPWPGLVSRLAVLRETTIDAVGAHPCVRPEGQTKRGA